MKVYNYSYSPHANKRILISSAKNQVSLTQVDGRIIIIIIKCIADRLCSSPSALLPYPFLSELQKFVSLPVCILLKHSRVLPIYVDMPCGEAGGFITCSVPIASKISQIVSHCLSFCASYHLFKQMFEEKMLPIVFFQFYIFTYFSGLWFPFFDIIFYAFFNINLYNKV